MRWPFFYNAISLRHIILAPAPCACWIGFFTAVHLADEFALIELPDFSYQSCKCNGPSSTTRFLFAIASLRLHRALVGFGFFSAVHLADEFALVDLNVPYDQHASCY